METRQRPEGPVVNSHGRKAVVNREKKRRGPKGPAVRGVPVLRTSNVFGHIMHGLTAVAINCRPFGPPLSTVAIDCRRFAPWVFGHINNRLIQTDTLETRVEAARIIRAGGIIAFRTDTFYGFGADPLNAHAVQKIKQLKGREDNKPILLLISDMDQVDRFVAHAGPYREIASQYWPAPLTLIGLAHAGLPEDLTAGSNSIGLRLPDDEEYGIGSCVWRRVDSDECKHFRKRACAHRKRSGKLFSTGVDLIIDGGAVTATAPSTVVDISGEKPNLIREGAVKRTKLVGLL